MQSRRDQVQAHLFVMGRLATGMLRGDPDSPDTPVGRTSRGTAGGFALGLALCIGLGIFGFISPGGSTGWQKAGTLVVVKGTGARFLYLAGELHPVLNETSAKLIAGTQMAVDQVSEASLTGAPRGTPVGILGAPDSLPDSGQLTTGPWLTCTITAAATSGTASTSTATPPGLALAVAPRDQGTAVTGNQGVLVSTDAGDKYLLWHGERLRLAAPITAIQALGYASVAATPVSAALLDVLPVGPDLAVPAIPGLGSPGPVLAGNATRVGQLFTGPSGDHYVLAQAGLVPLTTTMFDLIRGDPQTQTQGYAGAAVTVAQIGPADLLAHTATTTPLGSDARLPPAPPAVAQIPDGQDLCISMQVSATGPPAIALTLAADSAVSGQPPVTMPGVVPGCGTLDEVSVPPGEGAWVRALSSAGVGSTTYLVTDAGVKYPVPSTTAATQLGYNTTTPMAVPQGLLDLLPTGPSLDPAALAAGGGIVTPPTAEPICPGQSVTPTDSATPAASDSTE